MAFAANPESPIKMRKPHLVFILLTILHASFLYFEQDAFSVTPGWHTTLVLMPLVDILSATIILIIVCAGYWWLIRKLGKVSLPFFILHFLLTFPTLFYLRMPFFIQQGDSFDEIDLEWIGNKMIPAISFIFIIGQLLFLLYFTISLLQAKRPSRIAK